ncbi:hypothetical protein GS682_03495 [Nostoc sp. B(2019)]|nr:hypothetical protein [Nostoc sp. B(2019)]
MEITTFELLVKRIAPPPAPANLARRVVQGYFLTITNLESKDLTFRVRFNISRPNPIDPDRTLFNNVDLLYDIAGANIPLPLSGGVNSTVFGGSFVLPARQTASLQLLPKIGLFAAANPDFEVRGYVTLRLPRIGGQPQSDTPVKVLINPEIRGTFLPNGFPGGSIEDVDQINYPLAIASGKALNEIASDPPLVFVPGLPPILTSPVSSEIESLLLDADELEKSQSLVELMAQLDKDPQNLEKLSDLLSKSNIPIRVSPM